MNDRPSGGVRHTSCGHPLAQERAEDQVGIERRRRPRGGRRPRPRRSTTTSWPAARSSIQTRWLRPLNDEQSSRIFTRVSDAGRSRIGSRPSRAALTDLPAGSRVMVRGAHRPDVTPCMWMVTAVRHLRYSTTEQCGVTFSDPGHGPKLSERRTDGSRRRDRQIRSLCAAKPAAVTSSVVTPSGRLVAQSWTSGRCWSPNGVAGVRIGHEGCEASLDRSRSGCTFLAVNVGRRSPLLLPNGAHFDAGRCADQPPGGRAMPGRPAGGRPRLLEYLPRGNMLDDKAWHRRHRMLKWVLLLHVPGLIGSGPAARAHRGRPSRRR